MNELAEILRVVRDAVITFRVDGTIVSWNPAAEQLYGVRATDALGAPVARFVPDAKLAPFRAAIDALVGGDVVPSAEQRRVRADGREIDVEETMIALRDGKGTVARIAIVARDMTEIARLRRAAEVLSARSSTEPAISSPKMREALRCADLVAANGQATVLLLGETGVGKTWMARRIHDASPLRDGPFFEVNCAGLSGDLVESELFGHERGAFTGASAHKRGLVELAEGGTLFLDEVGELPLGVQAHLLTFLDTGFYRHVGGTRPIRADVRIIAATNVDLADAVERGRFRRDLYYRLAVVPIVVPPLRERRSDISAMARDILVELGRRTGHRSPVLTAAASAQLAAHDWPGNIRELRNALERALILARGAPVDVVHLSLEPGDAKSATAPLDDVERREILRALETTNGNRTHAAARLGISRSTLKRKLAAMRELAITAPDA
jgi:PAS domain S-box-containing protein